LVETLVAFLQVMGMNATLFTVEQLAQLVSASEILRQEAMGEVMSPEARGYLRHSELKACFHRFACFGLGVEPGLEVTVKTMDNAHFAKMVRGWGRGGWLLWVLGQGVAAGPERTCICLAG
jgi:hypothetical protein